MTPEDGATWRRINWALDVASAELHGCQAVILRLAENKQDMKAIWHAEQVHTPLLEAWKVASDAVMAFLDEHPEEVE